MFPEFSQNVPKIVAYDDHIFRMLRKVLPPTESSCPLLLSSCVISQKGKNKLSEIKG